MGFNRGLKCPGKSSIPLMNIIGISILASLLFAVLALPRRWALMAMLSGAIYLTQYQQIDILSINMYAMRFLELAGVLRIVLRREFTFSQFNNIDRALVAVYVYATTVYVLHFPEGRANMIGTMVDAIFCYFIFRAMIRNFEEFQWFLRAFIFLLAPFVFLIGIESFTGRNPFIILGAPAEGVIREGKPRCVGSFRHPSLLGTLGASFLPFYLGLCLIQARRGLGLAGSLLCLGIVWFSNSGGPILATMAALLGWGLWRIRTNMRLFRWGMAGFIVLSALAMKAPVWYLIAKASALSGGDGWHRSYLLDVFFRNISKWWFAGMPLAQTNDWFPYLVPVTQAADITNFFVKIGLNGGLAAIALLIFLLYRTYSNIGMALTTAGAADKDSREIEYILWGLGVTLTVHVVNWFGITYFDQTYVLWTAQMAMASTLTQAVLAGAGDREDEAAWLHSCDEATEAVSGRA